MTVFTVRYQLIPAPHGLAPELVVDDRELPDDDMYVWRNEFTKHLNPTAPPELGPLRCRLPPQYCRATEAAQSAYAEQAMSECLNHLLGRDSPDKTERSVHNWFLFRQMTNEESVEYAIETLLTSLETTL